MQQKLGSKWFTSVDDNSDADSEFNFETYYSKKNRKKRNGKATASYNPQKERQNVAFYKTKKCMNVKTAPGNSSCKHYARDIMRRCT